MRPIAISLLTLATLAAWLEPAFAEPAQPSPSPPPAVAPTQQDSTVTWGWLLVGTGLLAGGTLTGLGLTYDCGDTERACMRRASMFIWGGVGVAGLTSAIGIAMVQAGRTRVQVTTDPSALGLALRGSF